MKQEYKTIKKFYGKKTAKRSGLPLMNHIDEGLEILKSLNASETELGAFCLHPIIQNNESFTLVTKTKTLKLAEEYRTKANAYLCRPDTDRVCSVYDIHTLMDGEMSDSCRRLLFADKVQNQKDFLAYHYLSHERSVQLSSYFILWLQYLSTNEFFGDRPLRRL